MKKQTILVGFITAAFILVATGTSFAGDRRLHRPGGNHWKGKHFAAQKHKGNWKRGHQVRQPRANWKGRHQASRNRWNNRGVQPRPGYRANQNSSRRGWSPKPSFRHGPGQSGYRPPTRRQNDRHPANASFGRQHKDRGARGHVGNQADMRPGGRQGNQDDGTAYASDGTQSRRSSRDGSRQQ